MIPKSKTSRNVYTSDFPESLTGTMIQMYLSSLNLGPNRYIVDLMSPAHERIFGADARLHDQVEGVVPFYMQFKRPDLYTANATSTKIVKDRRELNATYDPCSLSFKLRSKKDHHHDFQHNILYRLNERMIRFNNTNYLKFACYVCPLFLSRALYRSAMSNLHIRDPYSFYFHRRVIRDLNDEHYFDHHPFLSEHVIIPPHSLVDTHKHSYSFSETGNEICFHSPKLLSNENYSLGHFIKGFTKYADELNEQNVSEKAFSKENGIKYFDEISREFGMDFRSNDELTLLQNFGNFGYELKNTYDIDQFGLVVSNDR